MSSIARALLLHSGAQVCCVCALHWTLCRFCVHVAAVSAGSLVKNDSDAAPQSASACRDSTAGRLQRDLFWLLGKHAYVTLTDRSAAGQRQRLLRHAWDN